ncbi:MAG: DNA-directed RNA polymerase subunit alpha [Campylobacteraceae bacterium 4484_4]|uniref:DNA-directed RNA polymerase subunit alpha n=1 Tax=Hydrogenimonas sp. TaxID=2231112 RepID=UPI000A0E2736|nr:DNA-directed RNA polymerase subunit alpha [Hydrogenimonas sp.]OQX72396.1 MAG: DNA-directed RNA polymerase subunit alpha [Campylobacteraceae bacterium 4484_4]
MKRIKTSPFMPSEVEIEQTGENRMRITAYPFETGYAVSLAHPIRRLLLGSTIGYAPIGVKIEGASHEFDSVRGMLEDVAVFIINLKNLRFKIKGDEKKVEVNYSFSGPIEITGADLNNDQVEVVTPDGFLATLNEDAELNFSLLIHQGIGYVPSEELRDSLPEGYIGLDAFFTPVRAANYTIENMLIEDNPNYEKIVFNIETDGQIDPVTAFKNTIEVMYRQMSVFNNILDIDIAAEAAAPAAENPVIKKLMQGLDTLGLSARSFNSLERAGLKFVGELALMSENELKEIKNLGKKSLEEIKAKLEEAGFPVGEELDEETAKQLKKKIDETKK